MPLLAEHGFTATLFVTTGWEQDADMRRAAPGRMLNRTQLTEAAAAGIEIGAHTRRHPQLDQLPEPLVREELCTSKRWLEDELGRRYPDWPTPSATRAPWSGRWRARRATATPTPSATGPRAPAATVPAAPAHHPAGHDAARIPPAGRRPATLRLREDRALTRGWSVARRIKAACC